MLMDTKYINTANATFLTNCFYFTFEKSDKFSSFSNKSSQDVIDISVIWLEMQKTTI